MALMHSEEFVRLAQPSSAWREALTLAWYYIRAQYSESSGEYSTIAASRRLWCLQMSSCFDLSILSQLRLLEPLCVVGLVSRGNYQQPLGRRAH